MPTRINLHVPAKERAAQNRVSLQKKATAQREGTYVEKPAQNLGWKDATKGAETRAGMNFSALKYAKENPEAQLEKQMSGPIKTPSGGRAAGALTKEPMPTNEAVDLGEKQPGATLGQAARARGIAKAQMNQSSTVGHEVPHSQDLHAKPWTPHTETGPATATGSGPDAGAMMGTSSQPKDLGRVTAKVVRGEYGPMKPKTAAAVIGKTSKGTGFLGRAAKSVKGLGSAMGVYGAVSLAAKATEAFQGMNSGKVVNPMTLDTSTPKEGDRVLTPTGVKKARKPAVES